MTQISPNPNIGVIRISDVEEHNLPKSFENEGKVIILSGGLFTNNAKYDSGFKASLSINPDTTITEIQNGGILRNQGSLNVYSKLVNQEGGSCINNSNMSFDGDDRPDAQFLNSGKFNNFFALDLDQSVITNKASGVVNNGVSPQAGGAPTKATITLTDSTFNNFGKVENYGSLMGDGYIYIDNIDNATWTNYAGSQIGGNLTIEGIMRGTANYTPGSSAGGININGSLVFSEDSSKIIELGGDFDGGRNPSDTEYDYIDVTGNLDNRGGTLEVSLIDGFTLRRNQEFIISKVDGEVTGTYRGLVEGALVGKFDSIYGPGIQENLYITYKAGDGNDIGLYTTNSSLAPSPSPDQEPVVPAPNPESTQTEDGFTQFTDADDVLTNKSDIKYRLMGGNDYLEVIGGNNYANGNIGEDTIILRGGKGEYLGGKNSDTFEVFAAKDGTSVNGNRGEDTITGSVSGVTYRGGKDNDTLAVSQGEVWGDLGGDVFRGVTGEGYAVIQDYTIGEDIVELTMDGNWSNIDSGLMFTDTSGDQVMLLVGISDIKQVAMV